MCELYIMLAFGLGLFSGWFANFLLTGKYIEKAIDEYYSKEKKEEIRGALHSENKKFRLSTAIWVSLLFVVFIFLVYMLNSTALQKNSATQAIDKADNAAIFDSLIESMKQFSR